MGNWELEKLYNVYQEVKDKYKPYNPRVKKGENVELIFEHDKGFDVYQAQAMYDSSIHEKTNKEMCTFICGGGLISGEWDGEKWRSDYRGVFY